MSAAALSCHGVLVRRGGATLLDVPRLDVEAGETLALLGPNGAGKSTLLGVLGLVEAPSSGLVRVGTAEARDDRSRRALRRRVTTQLQATILLDGTVAWNVALPLRLRGTGRDEVAAGVKRWTRAFGVEHLLDRHAAALSGGEARRTCLARAFAAGADALLVDEPLAGIDAPLREELLSSLSIALAERRFTTVLVTHDLGEALRLADRVAVMIAGRLRQIGRPSEVLAAPADPEVARLVGAETYLHGTAVVQGSLSSIRVGDVLVTVGQQLSDGEDVWVAIRPEDVTIHTGETPPPGSARNQLAAVVAEMRPRGATTYVVLDAGFTLGALILTGTIDALDLRPGRRVWASVKATAVKRV